MWREEAESLSCYLDFYSHISARCDSHISPTWELPRISTLTSLRDVTQNTVRSCLRCMYFYSHISARCDEKLEKFLHELNKFLLSHLCEMWHHICIHHLFFFDCLFLLSHLCEMWLIRLLLVLKSLTFLLSHLCEMWRGSSGGSDTDYSNFYSHISARCDRYI